MRDINHIGNRGSGPCINTLKFVIQLLHNANFVQYWRYFVTPHHPLLCVTRGSQVIVVTAVLGDLENKI